MSQARIADRASELGYSLGKGAVSKYFNGKHGERPSHGTLQAFADALDVPVSVLEEAASYTGREPFTPDPSSDRLTTPQRAAVNEVIRLLAEGNVEGGGRHESEETESLLQKASPIGDDRVRPLPDISLWAADAGDSEGERLAREAADRGEEPQLRDDED